MSRIPHEPDAEAPVVSPEPRHAVRHSAQPDRLGVDAIRRLRAVAVPDRLRGVPFN